MPLIKEESSVFEQEAKKKFLPEKELNKTQIFFLQQDFFSSGTPIFNLHSIL
jgi:hypothetical protein